MGRPIGSKNGHGTNSKPSNVSSVSKSFINGRKTSNSSHKPNSVNNGSNGKFNANNYATSEMSSSSSGFDRSQANIPYDIRINGFSSLLNTVKKATTKVKKLIVDECDIILECRVCRSLFRSLPNYLTHKNMYCKNTYNSLADSGYSQFIQTSSNSYEFNYHLDESLIDSVISSTQPSSPPINCKISRSNHQNLETSVNGSQSSASTEEVENKKVSRLHQIISRIAPVIENATRTPSAFYSGIVMRRNIPSSCGSSNSSTSLDKIGASNGRESNNNKQVHINFESIDSIEPNNGIVFQKILHYDPSTCRLPSSQEKNKCVIKPDTAVLGPDGKIIMCGESGTIEKIVNRIIMQVEEKHEEQAKQLTELNCPHCLTLFPTRKTLRIHVRAAHRISPEGGGDNSSIPVAAAQNSSAISEEAQQTSQTEYRPPPAKKYKRFHETTDGRDMREASPDIVDLKSSSTKYNGSISQQIVKSSPPKIMRDVQTLFSTTIKRPRGRPKKSTLLVQDKMMNGNHLQSSDLSRRLSASDSSEGGAEETLRRCGKSTTKPTTTFRRNLQNPSPPSDSCEFKCHKCSVNFSTKHEMTMHLATCIFNLGSLRHSRPLEQKKKISILIRHDYLNSNPTSSNAITNTMHNIRNNNCSLLGNPNDKTPLEKFNWPRWESQDLNTKPRQKDNCTSSSYKFDERRLDVQNNQNNSNFYGTTTTATMPSSQTRSSSPFNNNKFSRGYRKNYNHDQHHHDDLDHEIDDDAELDEENDDRSTEEQNSGDDMIDEISDDDGFPNEDEKNSNHGNTEESDRDSNVTDSGVSTTSILMRGEMKS